MEQLIIMTKNFNKDETKYIVEKNQSLEEMFTSINDYANIKLQLVDAKYITTFYKEYDIELTGGKYQLYSIYNDLFLIWRNTLPGELSYILSEVNKEELKKRFTYNIEE